MAMAARNERATMVRSRVHGSNAAESRVMVKRTAAVADVSPQVHLLVVPRRRRAARLIATGCTLLFVLMLGAASFQTQLARRQLTLDTMDRGIRAAHERYDVLRRERAELRSPGRLVAEAIKLGMVPADQTEFATVDPDVIATLQRSGASDGATSAPHDVAGEFERYADLKAQTGTAP